jgi:sulfotransferase family protein
MDSTIQGRALIISTGRCGSTLLSDLIAEDTETLSVQEFFAGLDLLAEINDGMLTGAEYWAMLSSPRPELEPVRRAGLLPKQVRYPASGRWAADLSQLPRILAVTLPKITPEPDQLFDVLAEQVPNFPRQRLGAHHHMFLDLLTTLSGRRRWVERSGASSLVAAYLLRTFTTAKIVHLTRNWEDTARSMSRHIAFQLNDLRLECRARFGADPVRVVPDQQVPDEVERYFYERLTAETLRERSQDFRSFLGMCAFMANQAEQALSDTPPQYLLQIRYEDLVRDPATELSRLGQFLEFDDWDAWVNKVKGRVVASSTST